MSWTCPYCGKENYQDDDIAHRPPRCTRCGQHRATPEEVIAALTTSRADLVQTVEEEKADLRRFYDLLSRLQEDEAVLRVKIYDREERLKLAQDAINAIDRRITIARNGPARGQDPTQGRLAL